MSRRVPFGPEARHRLEDTARLPFVRRHAQKQKDVIDETPGTYTGVAAIMSGQADPGETVHDLRPVVRTKG